MEPLTVIVAFRDGHSTIERLLDSLPAEWPVIVVDDQSRVPLQLHRPNVKVIRLERRGYFSGAVNRGIQACATDVLVLNQDVWFEGTDGPQALSAMDPSGAILGDGVMTNPKWPRGYVQGTCMRLARQAIDRIGLLNERDYPLWGSTCEWQLRACRAGFTAWPRRVPGLRHDRDGSYGAAIQTALRDEPHLQHWFIRTPPSVSVVIPCKNYGRFLPDAVASLVGGETFLGRLPGQTFQSFEVVLVDYGSTDDSLALARSLADDWKGIRLVQTPDEGTAEACNAGIRASHGEYLAMLDADDLMEPERLERMLRLAEAHPHAVVYDDLRLVQYGARRGIWNYPEYDFELILEKNAMHKGLLFPKRAWEEVGGYPKLMTDGREDWAFNIALGAQGWCGVHLAAPLYLARRAGHNRSDKNTNPLWHQRFLEKLHFLFPHLYAGERPMGCCGGNPKRWKGARVGATNGKPLSVQLGGGRSLPGAEGLVLLEYIAPDQADLRPFHGRVTGTPYWFGRVRLQGYVDARDAKGFCEFMGGRAFRIWTPSPEIVPKAAR